MRMKRSGTEDHVQLSEITDAVKEDEEAGLRKLLASMYRSVIRKRLPGLAKDGHVNMTSLARVWVALAEENVEEGSLLYNYKLLSTALLCISELWDEAIFVEHCEFVVWFLKEASSECHQYVSGCPPSELGFVNEVTEQVIKAAAYFIRHVITLNHDSLLVSQSDARKWLLRTRTTIWALLENQDLRLSKAVISQCGMAHAAYCFLLSDRNGMVVLGEEMREVPPISEVCIYHGVMVVYPSGDVKGISSIIIDRLLLFSKSQDPVVLTLTLRTLALWVDCAQHWDLGYSLDSALIQELEALVWDLWETHVEMIKGHLREIFSGILKLHVKTESLSDTAAVENDERLAALVDKTRDADFITKSPYYHLQQLAEVMPVSCIIRRFPSLPNVLITILLKDFTKTQLCQLTLSKLVQRHFDELTPDPPTGAHDGTSSCLLDNWRGTWIDELLRVQEEMQCESFRVNAGFIQYMKMLLHLHTPALDYILGWPGLGLLSRMMIVKSAINEGLLPQNQQSHEETDGGKLWRDAIPVAIMHDAIRSFSSQILQDVLWVVIHPSRSSTEPVLEEDIDLLRLFYSHNLANQSPAFRHNVYQWTSRLFLRMRDRLVMRKPGNTAFLEQQRVLFPRYQGFLTWMLELCWEAIYVDSCFSKKNLCLQFIRDMLQVFCNHPVLGVDSLGLMDWVSEQSRFERLIGVFHDSVQVNKNLALDICLEIPQCSLCLVRDSHMAGELLGRALLFAGSIKAEQYPAAANLFILLSRHPGLAGVLHRHMLHASLAIDEERLIPDDDETSEDTSLVLCDFLTRQLVCMFKGMSGLALMQATTRPVHGMLHCLFALLSRHTHFEEGRWGRLVRRVLDLCVAACEIVFPVVKQVAPEGYMPPDSEIVLTLQQFKSQCEKTTTGAGDSPAMPVTAQMVVFCSWRIVKEATFIMAHVLTSYSPHSGSCVTPSMIEHISEYITKIVVESRHLGAFEKSFLALQQIMKFLWVQPEPAINGLPRAWVDRVLLQVTDPDESSRFCLTRRSAGVPRYLEALLTTAPPLEMPRQVEKVMLTLQQAADYSENDEVRRRSKIHALNVLRYLYRCSAIGQLVHVHVPDGVKTSLAGFCSRVWSVQNASNLLFTAIIARVFGVPADPMHITRKNCLSYEEFFKRFPTVQSLLLRTLDDLLPASKQPIDSAEAIADLDLVSCSHPGLSGGKQDAGSLQCNSTLYPILLLLERLFVSEQEQRFLPFLAQALKLCGWNVMKMRLMVSRLVPSLIIHQRTRLVVMTKLLSTASDKNSSTNLRHGTLSLAHSILTKCSSSELGLLVSETKPYYETMIPLLTANIPYELERCIFDLSTFYGPDLKVNDETIEKLGIVQKMNLGLPLDVSQIIQCLQKCVNCENWKATEPIVQCLRRHVSDPTVSTSKDSLITIVKLKDPFYSDLVNDSILLLLDYKDYLSESDRKNLLSSLSENFFDYPEELQPNLLRLLSPVSDYCGPEIGNLLFTCSASSQSEQLRLSAARCLLDDSTGRPHWTIFKCVLWLALDDNGEVRKLASEKVARSLLSDPSVTLGPMFAVQMTCDHIDSSYPTEQLSQLYTSLILESLLEVCDFSDEAMVDEASLFEPTELNTFKDSRLLVDVCFSRLQKNSLVRTVAGELRPTLERSRDFLQPIRDKNIRSLDNCFGLYSSVVSILEQL